MPDTDSGIILDEIGAEEEIEIDDLSLETTQDVQLSASDWTTETILSQLRKGNIDLSPKFQRRDVWNPTKKSALIESIILNLPIPQIVLAERPENRNNYLVLDGKQRLLAIRQFCAESENPDDSDFNSLALKGLTVLKSLTGKTYRDIASQPALKPILDAFENHTIRTVVIRNWPNERYLHSVFHRLNSGSVPLNVQELRQVLNPGPFTQFVEEYCAVENAMRRALRIPDLDYRMRDNEMLLRYIAFAQQPEQYAGNLKKFLDEAWKEYNTKWEELGANVQETAASATVAVDTTIDIFGARNAFCTFNSERNEFERRFNRAVFDIMTYYFRNADVAEKALMHAQSIRDRFIELCVSHPEFTQHVTTTTKSMHAIRSRFGLWADVLRDELKLEIEDPPFRSSRTPRAST